ncbi:MAG: hypothetical protein ACOCX1_03400 [Fimbriimonadaceae bacterium]
MRARARRQSSANPAQDVVAKLKTMSKQHRAQYLLCILLIPWMTYKGLVGIITQRNWITSTILVTGQQAIIAGLIQLIIAAAAAVVLVKLIRRDKKHYF